MRFRQHQDEARRATRRLLGLFVLTVALTVLCANAALALIWRLYTGALGGYPVGFFETNTLVALGFILGGCWLETQRLRQGGAHVAQWLGGRELSEGQGPVRRRLRNVVDELAIASGLTSPRVFVLEREDAINAFAAGWEQQDSVVAVTRGALERLTRDELQGVLAHEFGHILNGDTRLNMRLIGYVYGLQMIFHFGRSLALPADRRDRRGIAVLPGLALLAAGFLGWMAGRLLQAAVSRQREFLADAHAVQFTRLPQGIGGALRKIAHQAARGEGRLHSAHAGVAAPLLLAPGTSIGLRWLATHPPLAERLQRIYGRPVAPLDAPVLAAADDAAASASLPPLPAFAPGVALAQPVPQESGKKPAGSADPMPADGAPPDAALHGLFSRITPPELLQAAVLAFLVPAPESPEHRLWCRYTADVSGAGSVQDAVWQLLPRRRQPWLERLLREAAGLPAPLQGVLRQRALQLIGVDGRLALHELLAALQIQHALSPHGAALAAEPRHQPLAARAQQLALLTAALASLLPAGQAEHWRVAVSEALGLPASAGAPMAPSASQLQQAVRSLRTLAMTHTPRLLKAWVGCIPQAPMPQPLADALRALCVLIDTPMPQPLVAMFDPPEPGTPFP